MYLSLQINKIVCHPERSEGPLFDVNRTDHSSPKAIPPPATPCRNTNTPPLKTKTRRRA